MQKAYLEIGVMYLDRCGRLAINDTSKLDMTFPDSEAASADVTSSSVMVKSR